MLWILALRSQADLGEPWLCCLLVPRRARRVWWGAGGTSYRSASDYRCPGWPRWCLVDYCFPLLVSRSTVPVSASSPFLTPCSANPLSEAAPPQPATDLPFPLDSSCRLSVALWSALLVWDSLVHVCRYAPPGLPSWLSLPATSSEWTS